MIVFVKALQRNEIRETSNKYKRENKEVYSIDQNYFQTNFEFIDVTHNSILPTIPYQIIIPHHKEKTQPNTNKYPITQTVVIKPVKVASQNSGYLRKQQIGTIAKANGEQRAFHEELENHIDGDKNYMSNTSNVGKNPFKPNPRNANVLDEPDYKDDLYTEQKQEKPDETMGPDYPKSILHNPNLVDKNSHNILTIKSNISTIGTKQQEKFEGKAKIPFQLDNANTNIWEAIINKRSSIALLTTAKVFSHILNLHTKEPKHIGREKGKDVNKFDPEVDSLSELLNNDSMELIESKIMQPMYN